MKKLILFTIIIVSLISCRYSKYDTNVSVPNDIYQQTILLDDSIDCGVILTTSDENYDYYFKREFKDSSNYQLKCIAKYPIDVEFNIIPGFTLIVIMWVIIILFLVIIISFISKY